MWTPGLADIDEAYVDAVPRFLVHALWAREPPAELAAAESAAVERLQAQGILKSRHVAADHGQAWLELRAPDSETVQRHLKTLPLYEYLKFEVTMLGV
ncbi:MAG: muconolactone Delta-isomerase family protein [Capsulimonas sp.]|uniref:muconolactone Delta-isomerase family protein n=1 Tax=Capsulimonas sp. TaxID=2494211 RepID=UPI0032642364